MPHDPAHQLNRSECQADFGYTIGVKTIKIQDTGKGLKSVGDDLAAVQRKIEGWHQDSIAGYKISHVRIPTTIRVRPWRSIIKGEPFAKYRA